MSAPIFPAEQMDRLLGLLIPDSVRKEGGAKLQECLRNMFDVAARVGHQQRAKETACAREEGYEAGRQEGLRECQACSHSEASAASSYASAAAQTETQTSTLSPPCSSSVAAVQTELVVEPTAPMDWAADTEALPISGPHPSSTPPPPRDFSVLCTGTSWPFASLQYRRRRSPRAPSSWIHSRPIPRQHTKSGVYNHFPQKRTPYYPSFRFAAPSTNSFLPGQVPTPLEWDRDPCLRDLGQALAALGWVRL
ncbi:hypothetical protein C8R45DRAFT_1108800 [Mycena sanguinolenta]|nr:hypothetical protein C8R45DRAFT_1108800 [Mycena sanguinolenta]